MKGKTERALVPSLSPRLTSSYPNEKHTKLGVLVHCRNPSTWETEAEGFHSKASLGVHNILRPYFRKEKERKSRTSEMTQRTKVLPTKHDALSS